MIVVLSVCAWVTGCVTTSDNPPLEKPKQEKERGLLSELLDPLPEGTVQEGTLVNNRVKPVVVRDVRRYLKVDGIDVEAVKGVKPYVVSKPAGQPGYYTWTEKWIADLGTFEKKELYIDFQQLASGTRWRIRQ